MLWFRTQNRHRSERSVPSEGLAMEFNLFPARLSRAVLGGAGSPSVYGFWVGTLLLGFYPKDLATLMKTNP